MELRSLYYFTVVAEELNITKAAERLNMTQPPLSSQLKQLEQELGVTLLDRSRHGMELTPEGQLLLERARQIIELTEKSKAEVENMGKGMNGNISVAMVEGRAPFLLARWISGYGEEFPNVSFTLWNGSGDDVINRLRQGLADVAVVAAPFDTESLHSVEIGSEPWVALISKYNPLSEKYGDEIPLKALAGERLIVPSRPSRVDAIKRWFAEAGEKPNIICELSYYIDAIALTEIDAGVSIFPQTTLTPNPLIVPKIIVDSSKYVKYALVWNKNRLLGEPAKEFINYVKDSIEGERQLTPKAQYIIRQYL